MRRLAATAPRIRPARTRALTTANDAATPKRTSAGTFAAPWRVVVGSAPCVRSSVLPSTRPPLAASGRRRPKAAQVGRNRTKPGQKGDKLTSRHSPIGLWFGVCYGESTKDCSCQNDTIAFKIIDTLWPKICIKRWEFLATPTRAN